MRYTDFLTQEEQVAVEGMIATAEKVTSGEIKVCVVQSSKGYSGFTKKKRVNNRADKEFFELGLDHTVEHTGILVMISLDERMVAVRAGRSIAEKCDISVWNEVVAEIIDGIKKGQNAEGLCIAVAHMGAILSEHFLPSDDNPDEISNEIIFKE